MVFMSMGERLSYIVPLRHSTPAHRPPHFSRVYQAGFSLRAFAIAFSQPEAFFSSWLQLTASLHSSPHSCGPLSGRTSQTNEFKSVSSPTPVPLTCLIFLLNIDYNRNIIYLCVNLHMVCLHQIEGLF